MIQNILLIIELLEKYIFFPSNFHGMGPDELTCFLIHSKKTKKKNPFTWHLAQVPNPRNNYFSLEEDPKKVKIQRKEQSLAGASNLQVQSLSEKMREYKPFFSLIFALIPFNFTSF